jgi:hypothetical protein
MKPVSTSASRSISKPPWLLAVAFAIAEAVGTFFAPWTEAPLQLGDIRENPWFLWLLLVRPTRTLELNTGKSFESRTDCSGEIFAICFVAQNDAAGCRETNHPIASDAIPPK